MSKIVKSILFVFILLFFACKSDDDGDVNNKKISGFFYKNCSNEPHANKTYYFESVSFGNITNSGTERVYQGEVTTDENGYFEFFYSTCSEQLQAKDATNGSLALTTFCVQEQNDTWYEEPTSSHYLKIMRDTNQLPNDTLYLNIPLNDSLQFRKIIGPFENDQLLLIDSVRFKESFTGYYGMSVKGEAYYPLIWGLGVNEYEAVKINSSGRERNVANLKQSVCGLGDTIMVDLRGYR